MNKILSICLVLIFTYPDLTGQSEKIELSKLRVADGLSQNYVSSIIKDGKGFIWIGTFWGGLNRYDGYNFIVYMPNPEDTNSISSQEICTIYEDKNGVLWIGTWDGLNRFSPEKVKNSNAFDIPHQKLKVEILSVQFLKIATVYYGLERARMVYFHLTGKMKNSDIIKSILILAAMLKITYPAILNQFRVIMQPVIFVQ